MCPSGPEIKDESADDVQQKYTDVLGICRW
jgi:hypothetical protein